MPTVAKQFYAFALGLLFMLAVPNTSGSVSDALIASLDGAEIVKLICHTDGKNRQHARQSLGFLISRPGSSRHDLALVTRHGLTSEPRHCQLHSNGISKPVRSLVIGADQGHAGDWAIVQSQGSFGRHAARLPLRPVTEESLRAFDEAKETVFIARALYGGKGTSCRLQLPSAGLIDGGDQGRIAVASCPMMPGMSGSAVIANVNGDAAIVGVTIGNRLDMSTNTPESKRIVGVVRLIDPQVMLAAQSFVR